MVEMLIMDELNFWIDIRRNVSNTKALYIPALENKIRQLTQSMVCKVQLCSTMSKEEFGKMLLFLPFSLRNPFLGNARELLLTRFHRVRKRKRKRKKWGAHPKYISLRNPRNGPCMRITSIIINLTSGLSAFTYP